MSALWYQRLQQQPTLSCSLPCHLPCIVLPGTRLPLMPESSFSSFSCPSMKSVKSQRSVLGSLQVSKKRIQKSPFWTRSCASHPSPKWSPFLLFTLLHKAASLVKILSLGSNCICLVVFVLVTSLLFTEYSHHLDLNNLFPHVDDGHFNQTLNINFSFRT